MLSRHKTVRKRIVSNGKYQDKNIIKTENICLIVIILFKMKFLTFQIIRMCGSTGWECIIQGHR